MVIRFISHFVNLMKPGVYMKHMGMKRGVCRCCECIGTPGSETKKKIRKSEKSSARQKAKVDIKKALTNVEKKG